jgi:hypothetical protein
MGDQSVDDAAIEDLCIVATPPNSSELSVEGYGYK